MLLTRCLLSNTTRQSAEQMTWNAYFGLRTRRNRARPLMGIPFFAAGVAGVVAGVPFNPFEPLLGIDPSMVMAMLSLSSGLVGYQVGAGIGQLAWRLLNRRVVPSMDRMDKIFYAKVKTYRAERGQSPYVNTMSGTSNLLKSMVKKPAGGNAPRDANAIRQDFYGEKIRSVQDYRHWLRRQRALTKEHLGTEAPPIRGVNPKLFNQ